LKALRAEFKAIPVVVLTEVCEADVAMAAGRMGADGFVLKAQLETKAAVCAIYCSLGKSLSVAERRAHTKVVHRDLLQRLERIKDDVPLIGPMVGVG
jgi:DNA-binding NarL/FixJ family response regulator